MDNQHVYYARPEHPNLKKDLPHALHAVRCPLLLDTETVDVLHVYPLLWSILIVLLVTPQVVVNQVMEPMM